MRVKTYFLILPEYDIALEQDKLTDFQKELDDFLGMGKSGIRIEYMPLNQKTHFVVNVWALCKDEKENEAVIARIETYLAERDIKSKKYENYLLWNEEIVFVEFKHELDRSDLL